MWSERTKKINGCKIILIISLILFGIISFVLVSGIKNPSDIDSYYHLRIAEQIKENNGNIKFLEYDTYSSYPGRPFTYSPGYSYLLYLLSFFGGLLFIWKFIPIVFLILTAIIIYLIGKKIFNERSALLASIFFLMTPFVFQHIFLNDVNPFIFFASALSSYLFILFLEKKTLLTASLFGLSMAILLMSWLGSLFFAIFFYLFLIIIVIYEMFKNKNLKFLSYSFVSIIIPIILSIIFIPDMALGCWKEEIVFCWLDLFGQFGFMGKWIFYILMKLKIVGYYSGLWWSSSMPDFTMGINEMQPTTIILFLKYLTVISVMSIVAIIVKLYGLFKNKTNRYHLFLISWFSIVLVFMVPHAIRYMFLLIIPLVILAGWITDKIGKNFNKYCYCLLVILLLIMPLIANVSVARNNPYDSLPSGYIEAVEWIKQNAQEKVFINYWQIGHLISYAGAKNAIDGLMYVQNAKENKTYYLHKFWLSNEKDAVEYMLSEGYEYVWVSKDYISASDMIVYLGTNRISSEGYFFTGEGVIASSNLRGSLMDNMLFYSDKLVCFDEVYHNEIVSIFEIKETCKNVN